MLARGILGLEIQGNVGKRKTGNHWQREDRVTLQGEDRDGIGKGKTDECRQGEDIGMLAWGRQFKTEEMLLQGEDINIRYLVTFRVSGKIIIHTFSPQLLP